MRRKALGSAAVLIAVSLLSYSPASAQISYKWGPYFRLRHEYMRNNTDVSNVTKDNRNYFRMKTSLWGQLDYNKNITLFAKLTNENRAYTQWQSTSAKAVTGKISNGYHYDINEVFFDNLYFDYKNALGFPVDFRVGRQDLMGQYADNFLISDGTPVDGSRSTYFNAVKGSWKINKPNSLDVVFIKDPKTDDILPLINRVDGESALNTTDETGWVVVHKNDNIKNLHLEDYYMYKGENEAITGSKFTNRSTQLNTMGLYAKYTLNSWTFKAQGAYQTGQYGEFDREGTGGYLTINKTFAKAFLAPVANIGYVYLSGDDKNTSKMEGWDPMWSRWVAFSDFSSEIMPMLASGETSSYAYWTNLSMWKAGLTLTMTKKAKITFNYLLARANEQMPASSLFGTGLNRGNIYEAKLDYAFNKYVTGFLYGEYFHVGSFYNNIVSDDAVFVRSNLEIKF